MTKEKLKTIIIFAGFICMVGMVIYFSIQLASLSEYNNFLSEELKKYTERQKCFKIDSVEYVRPFDDDREKYYQIEINARMFDKNYSNDDVLCL